MRLAGALVILLIAMIICSGCVDKYERQFGIKNPENFPNEFRNGPGSPDTVKSDPGDRQKAYEELLKTMDSEPGDTAPVVPVSATITPAVTPSPNVSKTNATSLSPDYSPNLTLNQTNGTTAGLVPTPASGIIYAGIPKYPDILNLGQVYTYGKTGYERDVTITKYTMKSSFTIKYAARYGTSFKTIEAENGSVFHIYLPPCCLQRDRQQYQHAGAGRFHRSRQQCELSVLYRSISVSR